MGFFSKIKDKMGTSGSAMFEEMDQGYVELDSEATADAKAKLTIRPFAIEQFEDIKPILDSLREGKTVALINIKPLKDKDLVELKRAINKLKKTCDAIDGDIAGFSENWIAAVPAFAHIHRGAKPAQTSEGEEEGNMQIEQY